MNQALSRSEKCRSLSASADPELERNYLSRFNRYVGIFPRNHAPAIFPPLFSAAATVAAKAVVSEIGTGGAIHIMIWISLSLLAGQENANGGKLIQLSQKSAAVTPNSLESTSIFPDPAISEHCELLPIP